jgi:hypothetical protein
LTFGPQNDLIVKGIFGNGIPLGGAKIDETDLPTEYKKT